MNGHAWTDHEIATLRKLWARGVITAKIGIALGLSKNAVIGKADRLGLPARAASAAEAGRLYGGRPRAAA